jgi:hypothetical protein
MCDDHDMEKKAIILATAEELRAARSRQPSRTSEELQAQRLRHQAASERFAADARNATLKRGLVKVAVG